MLEAENLIDLLRIRRAHLASLRRRPGYRGSAVGFKFIERERRWAVRDGGGASRIPAVILFVDDKLADLPEGDRLEQQLHLQPGNPDSLGCETDVVQGRFADSIPFVPSLGAAAVDRLRAVVEHRWIAGGIPLRSPFLTGSVACVVESPDGPAILTNAHVAGRPGIPVERTEPRVVSLGETKASFLLGSEPGGATQAAVDRYLDSTCWLDCARVGLPTAAAADARPGVVGLGPLGAAFQPALDSFELLGRLVVSVGATCGVRYGRIMGLGYEWSEFGQRFHADYLILGCENQPPHRFSDLPFAAEGDSGKLVLTADTLQPLGLLWGGHRLQFDSMHHQQAWCLATDINRVAQVLKIRFPGAGTPVAPVVQAPLPTPGQTRPPEDAPTMENTLNLRYVAPTPDADGRANEVQVLYDGRVVVHTINPDGKVVHLITVLGKGVTLWVAVGLQVRVVHGSGKLTVLGGAPGAKGKIRQVLPGGSLTVDANPFCVLEAKVKGGIYPSSNREKGILR